MGACGGLRGPVGQCGWEWVAEKGDGWGGQVGGVDLVDVMFMICFVLCFYFCGFHFTISKLANAHCNNNELSLHDDIYEMCVK